MKPADLLLNRHLQQNPGNRSEAGMAFGSFLTFGSTIHRSKGSVVEILLARPRRFCAGVVRAVQILERALEIFEPPVYVS